MYYSCLEPGLGKLLIAGGGNDAAMRKVEVIVFGGPGVTCEDIPDYPGADSAFSGTFMDDELELCGGAITDRRSTLQKVQCSLLYFLLSKH